MCVIETYFTETLLMTFFFYWFCVGFWFCCDVFADSKYRIKGDINWTLYKKSALYTLVMQITITPTVLYILIPAWKWRGFSLNYDNFISLESFIKIMICPFLSEIIFFYTHKLGHISYIYKRVHKIHHEWVIPCAVSASYCHPLEFIFCNLATFIIPPFIVNLNGYAMRVWFILASLSVINSHSGYKYPNGSIRHKDHHKYHNRNYGPLKILDSIYGTEIPIKNKT